VSVPQRLIQITDLHLCAEPGDIMCSGVVTDASLRRVLDEILAREGPGTAILASGDLVQDPMPQVYRRLRDILAACPFTFHCLPGNHDDTGLMRRLLVAPNLSTAGAARLGGWSLILLDSSVPGAPHGRLGRTELDRLRRQLAAVQTPDAVVALHHHPTAVGSPWMDRMALADRAEFFDILATSECVRAVLFGHVHQEVDVTRNGIRLLGSPSTCVQFLPRTLTMGLDRLAPAYRWLDLAPDGRVDTGIVYLEEQRLLIDA
jgi:Icc protein